MFDPITLVEIGSGAVGFFGAATASRVGYLRSRNKHRDEAIQARSEADETYVRLSDPLVASATQVEGIIVLLGPHDTTAFREEAAKVLDEAQNLADSYAVWAYRSGDAASPSAHHSRGTYIQITKAYGKFKDDMAGRVQALQQLASRCEHLTASINALPGTAEAVQGVIQNAEAILTERETGGWVVISMRTMLDEARDIYGNAEESRGACEYLTAIDEYSTARKLAATAASNARELPKRQQTLLRKATAFERQVTELRRLIAIARSSIPVLLASYADECARGLTEQINAAEMQLEQFNGLIEELRIDTEPSRDAWDAAEAIVGRLDALVAEIKAACQETINAKATLDAQLQEVKVAAARLANRIQKLHGSISSRDYNGDQAEVRNVLACIEVELAKFTASLANARPNPQEMQMVAEGYSRLLDHINRASRAINNSRYKDGDNILKGVKTTGEQLGIDFSSL